jgi:hypothetical protein
MEEKDSWRPIPQGVGGSRLPSFTPFGQIVPPGQESNTIGCCQVERNPVHSGQRGWSARVPARRLEEEGLSQGRGEDHQASTEEDQDSGERSYPSAKGMATTCVTHEEGPNG